MPIQLTWKPSTTLAAMHLAYCASHFADSTVFRDPKNQSRVVLLGGAIKELVLPLSRVWGLIFQLSPDSHTLDDLAGRLSLRCLRAEERSEALLSRLRSSLREAELAFASEHPEYVAEMSLRQRPMQEQWEAYGPGLIFEMQRLLGGNILVEQAEICLVPPVSGGFGWAHLHTNRCHFEALLTNADQELTEVLRLAWLVGQLDFDRPQFSDRINAFQLPRVAGMAMLPPTLAAGEHLGLCRLTDQTLQRAIHLWRLEQDADRAGELAELLMVWWETASSSQADWPVALTGLDRMLSSHSSTNT